MRRLLPAFTAVLLAGCVTPAFDRGAYLQNAKAALESGVSEVRTAQLAVEARLQGDATRAFTDTVVTTSEGALGPVQLSFGGVDPVDRRDDELRTRVLGELGNAEDVLADARLAVRRDDRPALRQSAAELREAGDRLEQTRSALR